MWFAQAPANIALIKYMGKMDPIKNIPANPSLSYTLDNLLSFVEIEKSTGNVDRWEPLQIPGAGAFSLSDFAQKRFLEHLSHMKSVYQYSGHLVVRSCNNFPTGSGLASSASSFAALTKCASLALSEITGQEQKSLDELANLSRTGSGSSCRSFYSPWALWDDTSVQSLELSYSNLIHHVILISKDEKLVSSSAAHQLVVSSPFYAERPTRAKDNLRTCLDALYNKNWDVLYNVVWREFMDMHNLFATCEEPFSYITDETRGILDDIARYWETHGDGPLVTMDAGPNIHLLFRDDQQELANHFRLFLLKDHDIL